VKQYQRNAVAKRVCIDPADLRSSAIDVASFMTPSPRTTLSSAGTAAVHLHKRWSFSK
jgi:hypothetical protein